MKKNPAGLYLVSFFVVLVLLYACSKGDQGATGPAGPTGATGNQGTKGDTGTANVIYSAWLDVAYTGDTIHVGSVVDTIGYFADLTVAKLTSSMITSGEIKMYVNFGTTTTPDVFMLPYTDVYSGLNITPEFLLQRIHLYATGNLSTITKNSLKYFQYRYILIPGTVSGRVAQTLDWNNYMKIKETFKLPD